jgi:predicted solute-binding protein
VREHAAETARIGCVPYLNARPLLEGIPYAVRELVPARLHDVFQAGEFDAALLSSVDVISMPRSEVVDGAAIGSRGDVHSVILAYTGELKAIRRVRLDPSSHTSNALLRIVLEEFHGIGAEYVSDAGGEDIALPSLLIGDPAISFRKSREATGVQLLDLGGEWFRSTGLPFVYALWALNPDYSARERIAGILRMAKQRGVAALGEIALRTEDPEFARRYLGGWIRYELGEEEKRGMRLFGELLTRHRLVPSIGDEPRYW